MSKFCRVSSICTDYALSGTKKSLIFQMVKNSARFIPFKSKIIHLYANSFELKERYLRLLIILGLSYVCHAQFEGGLAMGSR